MVGIGNIGGILGPSLYGFLYLPGDTEEEEGSYILGHLSMAIGLLICIIISIGIKKTTKTSEETAPLLKDPSYEH